MDPDPIATYGHHVPPPPDEPDLVVDARSVSEVGHRLQAAAREYAGISRELVDELAGLAELIRDPLLGRLLAAVAQATTDVSRDVASGADQLGLATTAAASSYLETDRALGSAVDEATTTPTIATRH